MIFDVTIDGQQHRVELEQSESSGTAQQWTCRLDGRDVTVDVIETGADVLSLIIDGHSFEVERERFDNNTDEALQIAIRGERFAAEVRDPRSLKRGRGAGSGDGPRKVNAPMPGKIIRVIVKDGQKVEAGDSLMVIEAMKMQNEIKSPKGGIVVRIEVKEGATVNAGELLAVVE